VLEKAINDAMKVGEAEINELKGGACQRVTTRSNTTELDDQKCETVHQQVYDNYPGEATSVYDLV
jgi:hypothetical protein